MIGFPWMICQFDAHKGPQEVSKNTCGHLQYVFFALDMSICPTEKVLHPNLGKKKVLCLMIGSPRMVLPVWCPQRSSGGLNRHLWTLPICLCALDMWIWPTEKVLQPNPGSKKVLWVMIGSPRRFCQFDAHKGPQEVSRVTCGHLQYVCVPWTYEFDQQKKFSNQA